MTDHSLRTLLVWPGKELRVAPLGLGYISAVLERCGFESFIACSATLGDNGLSDLVQQLPADVVGFSALTCYMDEIYRLARRVKEVHPRCIVVVGGPHATALPELTLAQCPAIDFVVVGEGQETCAELLVALERGQDPAGIAGLAFRRGDDVQCAPPRRTTRPESLPFPKWALVGAPPADQNHYRVKALWGCARRCLECANVTVSGHAARLRAPQSLLDEIEARIASGARRFTMPDCLPFRTQKEWLRSFVQGVHDRSLDNKFTWEADPFPAELDAEAIHLLVESGCDRVDFWTSCSGSDRILRGLKKPFTAHQLADAVAGCKRAGLRVSTSFTLGLLGETRETALETIEFVRQLGIDGYWFGIARPFPGTELYRQAIASGLALDRDWETYEMSPTKPVGPLWGTTLSIAEVFDLVQLARQRLP